MDERRMSMLAKVAEHHSISGAARSMNFTPSAVSQQIRALEQEVGMPLIERHSRGVSLTDAGMIVAEAAMSIEQVHRRARAQLADIAGRRTGSLRLGTFPAAAASIVPRAVRAFRSAYPNIELTVSSAARTGLLELLHTWEVELTHLWEFPWDRVSQNAGGADLELLPILDDPLELIVSPSHRLAGAGRVTLADLAAELWVSRPPDHPVGAALRIACEQAGFSPQVSYVSHESLETQAIVAAGLGISLLPRLALNTSTHDVSVVELRQPGPVRTILIARVRDRLHAPAATAMWDLLRSTA